MSRTHSGVMTRHVMFVISGLERGGAENQLVGTAAALSSRGWNVTVLSFLPFSTSSWAAELKDTGVTLLTLNASPGLRSYYSFINAVRNIRRLKPDILVGYMFHGIMTARLAGRLSGVSANVSSLHNERDGAWRERLMGATDRLADAVTVLSHHLAYQLVQRRVISESHVHVIPNLVDVALFHANGCRGRVREEIGVTDDQFLWLAAGRLDKAKDYPNLLNAFSMLFQGRPDARLMIAGDGPLVSELHSMVRRLGMDRHVCFLGLRLDMPALYAASDALVLSSSWEGMPVVILEAMASERPVVATHVGAVPEVVVDGKTGLIVSPRNCEALAEAMDRLMELPEDEQDAFRPGRLQPRTF